MKYDSRWIHNINFYCFWLLLRILRRCRNRLMISRYRLIQAMMYSSGETLCMIRLVSNTMNRLKTKAPPTLKHHSRASEYGKNSLIMPPISNTSNATESLKKTTRNANQLYSDSLSHIVWEYSTVFR